MSQQTWMIYRFGRFSLEAAERTLLRDGMPVPLTPKVFDTLLLLVENRGKLVEKSELMKRLWPDTFVEEVTLASNISDVRKALGEGTDKHKFIQTVPKSGYRFVAKVEVVDSRTSILSENGSRRMARPATMIRQKIAGSVWRRLFLIIALAAGVIVVLLFLYSWRVAEPPRMLKVQIALPQDAVLSPTTLPALSPDGRHLAFALRTDGKQQIWLRDLDSPNIHRLPGVEEAGGPFWSPDSRFIGFFADGKLKKMRLDGDVITDVCDAPSGGGGTWGKNQVIVFSRGEQLHRVDAHGGHPTQITAGKAEIYHGASFLPDGHHFLYTVMSSSDPGKIGIYVRDLRDGTEQLVLAENSNAVYAPPGYLLFTHHRALFAQSFDLATFKLKGEPNLLAEGMEFYYSGLFSASQNGVLAYLQPARALKAQLTWYDRLGKAVGVVGEPGIVANPAISPDGRAVAYCRVDIQTGWFSIWLHDLARDVETRFTPGSMNACIPLWSPDGESVLFNSANDQKNYRKAVNGNSSAEVVDRGRRFARVDDWSRDGRYMVEETLENSSASLWLLPLFGAGRRVSYLQSEFVTTMGRISPDSNWLAYLSNETGKAQVYIQSFPTSGHKIQVSSSTRANDPTWRRDGKELFFISGKGTIGDPRYMMALDITATDKLEGSKPKPLFELHAPPNAWFDVNKEGQFLIPALIDPAEAPIEVIVNWTASIKR